MKPTARLTFIGACLVCLSLIAADDDAPLTVGKNDLGILVPMLIDKDGHIALDKESWNTEEANNTESDHDKRMKDMQAKMGRDFPEFKRPPVGHYFAKFTKTVGCNSTGSGASNTDFNWHAGGPSLNAKLDFDKSSKQYELSLKELGAAARAFRISDDVALGVSIQFSGPKFSILFSQSPSGQIGLIASRGDQIETLTAPDMVSLLKKNADKVQILFLRPLADIGITPPPSRWLPPVMAAATTGFVPASPEIASKVADNLKKLANDDQDIREEATRELIKLFPLAIFDISSAAAKTSDPEVKTRLDHVIAAHPGIARARAFVEKEKLHEDRAYLLDMLANVPFFKAAARARLAALLGKDYGDDAAAWPKDAVK